jgi:hypothetical protein
MEIIDSSSDKIKVVSPTTISSELTSLATSSEIATSSAECSQPTKRKRLKIGITSQEITDLFCNGLRFNNMLWYDFLTNCGYDVYFLTTTDYTHADYRFLNYCKLWDEKGYRVPDFKNKNPELFDLDYIFIVGIYSTRLSSIMKQHNIKLIYIILGSVYHNDVHSLIDDRWSSGVVTNEFDQIWISPHFEYCLQYYKIRYSTDNIFIGPYFWRDDLFKNSNLMNTVRTDVKEHLRVAICEPNLEQAKNSIIPIAICEKAYEDVERVYAFSTVKVKEVTFFKNFCLRTKLHKNAKFSVESRYPMPFILTKYCNCVVSYVEDCDLNYLFIECFYLGVPLVHNSPMLKDYGYYYPRLQVDKGAEQLKYIKHFHNREEYIKKHRPIVEKYAVDNPVYIEWAKRRLELSADDEENNGISFGLNL